MGTPLNRLDNYILKQIAIAASVITLSLTFIVWITQSLKLVDFIVNRGIPLSTFGYLALLTLPGLLPVILPLTVFTAVLFVFYRLSSDSELIAMHTGGLGAMRVGKSALVFAVFMTGFTYFLTLYLTPLSFTEFKDMQFRLRNDYSMTLLEEGVFTQISKGITVFIRERNSDKSLSGILVHDNRDPKQPVTVLAEKGVFSIQGGSPVIAVTNGSRQVVNHKNGSVSMLYFDSYTLNLNQITNEANNQRVADAKEMSTHDLLFPDPALDARIRLNYQAVGHQRLIGPLAILAFTMIALASFRRCLPRRQSNVLVLAKSIVLVIALQGLMLMSFNVIAVYGTGLHTLWVILSYALPITVILFCWYLLQTPHKNTKSNSFPVQPTTA